MFQNCFAVFVTFWGILFLPFLPISFLVPVFTIVLDVQRHACLHVHLSNDNLNTAVFAENELLQDEIAQFQLGSEMSDHIGIPFILWPVYPDLSSTLQSATESLPSRRSLPQTRF